MSINSIYTFKTDICLMALILRNFFFKEQCKEMKANCVYTLMQVDTILFKLETSIHNLSKITLFCSKLFALTVLKILKKPVTIFKHPLTMKSMQAHSTSSPAFAFSATMLSQYINNIIHYIVKNSQYCLRIVTILSTYCDNIVNIFWQ